MKTMTTKVKSRCAWAESDPLLREYHDTEWGVPIRDSRTLWELLMLEGFQAGLAWITVLRKRETYREAFDGFDAEKIARYNAVKRRRLPKLFARLSTPMLITQPLPAPPRPATAPGRAWPPRGVW